MNIKLSMQALYGYSENNREDKNSKNIGMDLGELLTIFYFIVMHQKNCL